MRLLPPVIRAAVAAVFLLLSGCSALPHRLDITDRQELSRMMTDLGQSRVVLVGEFHDQRDHHLLQLEVIKALAGQGKSLAIGFEMFDLEKQPVLDEWVQGKIPLQDFVDRYSKGWSISWAEYDSIMLFARNNGIPMVGLDAPADIVRLVTHRGPPALGPGVVERLPAGVDTSISPSYRKFMAKAFRSHEIPDEMFDNFCAAQGLRNSTMARRIADYLQKNPDRQMVVIAGVGHVMRRAVPAALAGTGLSSRIVVPKTVGLYEELDGDDMDYYVTGRE